MITKYGGGARLKEARKNIGISQKDLAKVLELSPAYLSLIETERQPISEPIAIKMRDLYGVDARWLLYGIAPKGEKSRLRQARDELGLKQKDMARELGISAQYLGMMERGDQPLSEPVAMKMESLYGYNAEWILFGKANEKELLRSKTMSEYQELAEALQLNIRSDNETINNDRALALRYVQSGAPIPMTLLERVRREAGENAD